MHGLAAPGSVLWLLGHDMRLSWRDLRTGFRGLGSRSMACLLALLVVIMHLAAWPIAAEFSRRAQASPTSPAIEAEAAALVAFVLLVMLAQTLNGVTKLLYSRGDLDLLLSAPLPPRRIFLVRSLAVGSGAVTSAAIFIVPLADMGLIGGDTRFLALYPTLLGCALTTSALAIVAALVLFRLVGAKATRLVAQILATLFGAGFMLALQLHKLLPSISATTIMAAVHHLPFGLGALLLLPVAAGLGRPVSLVVWVLASAALFGLVASALGGRLAHGVQAAASVAPTPADRRSRKGQGPDFRAASSVLSALRRKERQLILRDPWIVSQILLQVLYMSPMAVLLWTGAGSPVLALTPMIVVIAFQVASSLTWLGLSGEDAPELLATAPVPPGVVRRGKLEAVAGLTFAIVGLPLVWLAVLSPPAAALALGLALLGIGSAVLLQLWQGRPGRRSVFAARHRESKLLAMIEMGLSILWGITAALLVVASPWALAPFGAVGVVLLCCRPRKPATEC